MYGKRNKSGMVSPFLFNHLEKHQKYVRCMIGFIFVLLELNPQPVDTKIIL
jgi:hypothetical protein